MKRIGKFRSSSIAANNSSEGETLERKIERRLNNKENLEEPNVGLTYTERKHGVIAAYDVRTDRFEVALDATDKITKSVDARREERQKPKENGGAEPTGGTELNIVK